MSWYKKKIVVVPLVAFGLLMVILLPVALTRDKRSSSVSAASLGDSGSREVTTPAPVPAPAPLDDTTVSTVVDSPSLTPSDAPSLAPSDAPSLAPSDAPSDAPSMVPSLVPTTNLGSDYPSIVPSTWGTEKPSSIWESWNFEERRKAKEIRERKGQGLRFVNE